jgi:ABC-2 type transport system permease protein
MIREHLPPESAVAIALANPLQVFRTAAMILLDQQLVLLGASAYVILDNFGKAGYIAYALLYPTLLGTLSAVGGYLIFRRGDLP